MTTLIVVLVSAAAGFVLGFIVAKNNPNKVNKVENVVNELKK